MPLTEVTLCFESQNQLTVEAFLFPENFYTPDGYALVITNLNNEVIGVLEGQLSIVFTLNQLGAYMVWGLAYTGTLTIPYGEDVTQADFSDACFDLSDNFVTILVEDCFAPNSN